MTARTGGETIMDDKVDSKFLASSIDQTVAQMKEVARLKAENLKLVEMLRDLPVRFRRIVNASGYQPDEHEKPHETALRVEIVGWNLNRLAALARYIEHKPEVPN